MTDIERLESEIEKRKTDRTRALVVIEQIESKWMTDYGTKDPADIANILESLKAKIVKLKAERDEKMSEANKLLG